MVIDLEHFRTVFRSYFRWSKMRPEVVKWGQVRLILGSGLSLCLGQSCSHCDIFIQFKNHVMYYTFTTLVPCGFNHSINKREIQTVQFANKVTLSRHMMVIWQGTELGSRDRRTTTRLTDDEKVLYIDHTFTNHDQSTRLILWNTLQFISRGHLPSTGGLVNPYLACHCANKIFE